MTLRNGKAITKRRIYETLHNIFYTGKFRWNGVVYPSKHEPIISEELFDLVQVKMSGKSIPHNVKRNFVLKGLLKCEKCGTTIAWEEHKGIIYGHCNYHYSGCEERGNKWLTEEEAVSQIAEAFGDLVVQNPKIADWIQRSLRASHKDETEYRTAKVVQLEKSHEIINKKLDVLYEDRLSDLITTDYYKNKASQLSLEKEAVLNELKRVSAEVDENHHVVVDIFEAAQQAQAKFMKKDPEERRKLVRMMSEKILVSNRQVKVQYNAAFELLAKAAAATNSSKTSENVDLENDILEPLDFGSKSNKKGSEDPVCSIWRPGPGSNRRPPP